MISYVEQIDNNEDPSILSEKQEEEEGELDSAAGVFVMMDIEDSAAGMKSEELGQFEMKF